MAARQQNVLGLDVAVDHPLRMREGERVRDVAGDVKGVLERQLALAQQAQPQRLPLYVRHDVVEQPAGFPGREDRHDVRMAELGGEVHFTEEALTQEPTAELRGEHLDRDAPLGVLLERQVHARHAPGPDFAYDIVVGREPFPH